MDSTVIVGGGCIGRFYAAQFAYAGMPVSLISRHLAQTGERPPWRIRQRPTPQVASTTVTTDLRLPGPRIPIYANGDDAHEALAQACVVLLAVPTAVLPTMQAALAAHLAPAAIIAVMADGFAADAQIAAWAGGERTALAVPFIAIDTRRDGVIEHHGHGHVWISHHRDCDVIRKRLVVHFALAGIKTGSRDNRRINGWLRRSWDGPWNALSALHGVGARTLVGERAGRQRLTALVAAFLHLANRDLAAHWYSERIEQDWIDACLESAHDLGDVPPPAVRAACARSPIDLSHLIDRTLPTLATDSQHAATLADLIRDLDQAGIRC